MVVEVEREVISGVAGNTLIEKNVNFFAKSFLISACAHLEMCVKRIVFEVAREIDARLMTVSIPSSFVGWRYGQKKSGENAVSTKPLIVNMTIKEVDDMISGNVYKTKEALAIVGVDVGLEKAVWESWKESIQAIVTRRNNIVHHNDDASDISLGDIRIFIATILKYIDFIISACCRDHSAR